MAREKCPDNMGPLKNILKKTHRKKGKMSSS
jgi:hypothetical protein